MTPLNVVIFAEAPADAAVVAILVDRVLSESACWISDLLEVHEANAAEEQRQARTSIRSYRDASELEPDGRGVCFIDVHALSEIAALLRRETRSFRIARGFFDGKPGCHSAKLGRKAIAVAELLDRRFRARDSHVDVAVIAQDMDGDTTRRSGLEQARTEATWARFAIVLACPNQCHEAWVVAGLACSGDAELTAVEAVIEMLGFDPLRESERLHHDHARQHSASAILERIAGGSPGRRETALRTTPLSRLHERGSNNGLSGFLMEVGERIVPRVAR